MKNVTEACLKTKRDSFYNKIVSANYKMNKFLKGWLNRSKSVYDYKYEPIELTMGILLYSQFNL